MQRGGACISKNCEVIHMRIGGEMGWGEPCNLENRWGNGVGRTL